MSRFQDPRDCPSAAWGHMNPPCWGVPELLVYCSVPDLDLWPPHGANSPQWASIKYKTTLNLNTPPSIKQNEISLWVSLSQLFLLFNGSFPRRPSSGVEKESRHFLLSCSELGHLGAQLSQDVGNRRTPSGPTGHTQPAGVQRSEGGSVESNQSVCAAALEIKQGILFLPPHGVSHAACCAVKWILSYRMYFIYRKV